MRVRERGSFTRFAETSIRTSAPAAQRSPANAEAIGVLTLLALMNIVAVLRTPEQEAAHLQGWRSGPFARLLCAGSPAMVIGVGTLFALSFDTVSQAALFAVTAAEFGGWRPALVLAMLFFIGMLLIDGVNSAWIARLIRRSDRGTRAAVAISFVFGQWCDTNHLLCSLVVEKLSGVDGLAAVGRWPTNRAPT